MYKQFNKNKKINESFFILLKNEISITLHDIENVKSALCKKCENYKRQCRFCRMYEFVKLLKLVYLKNVKIKEALYIAEREYKNARLKINKKYDRELCSPNIKLKEILV